MHAAAQESLQSLRTPGIQAFLHTLPVVPVLWCLVDVTPLTVPVLRGVAPTAVLSAAQVVPYPLHGRHDTELLHASLPMERLTLPLHACMHACMQVLSLFGALLYCDVKLVLAAVTLLPEVLAATRGALQARS